MTRPRTFFDRLSPRRTNQFSLARRLSLIAIAAGFIFLSLPKILLATATGQPTPLRFGFSASMLGDVNKTDGLAAVRIWGQTIIAERGVKVDLEMIYFNETKEIQDAMLSGQVDGVSMSTVEYWALHDTMPVDPSVLVSIRHGRTTEEYILLVHQENPAVHLADLRGQAISIIGTWSTSLAGIWLETTLLEQQLGTLKAFFGQATYGTKANQVALPVFFRQRDACVITKAAYRTMCELNPQLEKQLRIITQSLPYLPTVFCFRKGLDSPAYRDIISSLEGVTTTATGRQTLALFQTEKVVTRPLSEVDPTFALLDHHQELINLLNHPAPTQEIVATRPNPKGASR